METDNHWSGTVSIVFSRLGISRWVWTWHHSRGDKSIYFLPLFPHYIRRAWIKVLNRYGRPVAAVSYLPYHWRWTTTRPWTLWTARWSLATLPPATVSSTLWTAEKTGRQVTSLDGIGRHGLILWTREPSIQVPSLRREYSWLVAHCQLILNSNEEV